MHGAWREPPPPFDAAAFDPARLERARRGWQRLYRDERDSLIAGALLLTDLTRLGAPPDLLAGASRVVEDEVRHVRVCRHVVTAYGAPPEDDPPGRTRQLAEGTVAERAAGMAILGFCVGESMSAASFAEARERCGPDLPRWAYTELLRDEARHGGFGADAGAWIVERHLDAAWAATLWPAAVAEMEAMERRVGGPWDDAGLAREAALDGVDALEALGLLRGSRSAAAFSKAIERWVVPRLRKLGVAPG